MRPARLVVAALVAALAWAPLAVPSASAAPPAGQVSVSAGSCRVSEVRAEADWVLTSRTSVGAIAQYPDLYRVEPYLGNFAAMGLAAAASCTGDPRYLDAAWDHLAWYASVQDSSGFVHVHLRSGSGYVSTGEMDSTDGYAGTFLVAAELTSRVSGDAARLLGLHEGIRGAFRAIVATQDVDGLTWAKPTWRVKYLMDQAEAIAGLDAAVVLAARLGDPVLAEDARAAAARMRSGLASLWVPGTASYVWALHDGGGREVLDRRVFYPGSVSQVWPGAFGVDDRSRSRMLVDRLVADHPSWSKPTKVVPGSVEYWPGVAWSLAASGRAGEADRGARSIRDAAVRAGRAWPYNPGVAGQLLVVLSGGSAVVWVR